MVDLMDQTGGQIGRHAEHDCLTFAVSCGCLRDAKRQEEVVVCLVGWLVAEPPGCLAAWPPGRLPGNLPGQSDGWRELHSDAIGK